LILLWEFSLFGQPCKEGSRYFEVALASTTVCLALFANYDWTNTNREWRIFAKGLLRTFYDLLGLVLLLIVISIPIAILTPAYSCYTPRARVGALIMQIAPIQEKINTRILQNGFVSNSGKGLKIEAVGHDKGGFITKDGTITMISENPPAVVMLIPDLVGHTVTWKCTGYPAKNMPLDCRNE
jgi:hypothetical protein